MVYIANDLTKNGLQLITEPITDEEFFINRKYFPLNPGVFVYHILLKRLYNKLTLDGVINEKELTSSFTHHLEDGEQYFNFAKGKFNYINKFNFTNSLKNKTLKTGWLSLIYRD